jgi:hypothetical protein
MSEDKDKACLPLGRASIGYEEITPPHLALMKVEIQAKGCFFICSLVPIAIGILLLFSSMEKRRNKYRSRRLRSS